MKTTEDKPSGLRPDEDKIREGAAKPEPRSDGDKNAEDMRGGYGGIALRVTKWLLWGVAGVVGLLVLAVAGATFWLTPDRLTEIVNREGSKLMNADIRASNVRWTFWSSFPRVAIELDTLSIRSRNLDSISNELREKLPENADFLLSVGKTRGAINVHDLIGGRIELRDVSTEKLKVNLVAATDSLNNYDILRAGKSSEVPRFGANRVELIKGGEIAFTSLPDTTRADIRLTVVTAEREEREERGGERRERGEKSSGGFKEKRGELEKKGNGENDKEIKKIGKNSYRVKVAGVVSAEVDSLAILEGFPFDLDGIVGFAWKPFRVMMSDYGVKLGNTNGLLTMRVNLSKEGEIEELQYRLPDFSVNELLKYFPFLSPDIPQGIDGNLHVEARARLTSPLRFSSTELPSGIVEASILPGEIGYEFGGKNYLLRHSRIEGELLFDGKNPAASSLTVAPFRLRTGGEAGDEELTLSGEVENLLGDAWVTARADGSARLGSLTHLLPAAAAYDIEGRGEFAATVRFCLADAENGRLDMVKAGGEARFTGLSGQYPGSGLRGSLGELAVNFKEQSRELSATSIGRSMLDFAAAAHDLRVKGKGVNARLGTLAAKTEVKLRGGNGGEEGMTDSLLRLVEELPIGVELQAGKFHVELPQDTLCGDIGDLRVKADLIAHPSTGMAKEIRGSVTGKGIDMRGGKSMVELGDMLLNVDAKQLAKPGRVADYVMPAKWSADAEGRRISSHTPAFLQVALPKGLRRVLETWRGNLQLKVSQGWGSAPVFPVKTNLSDLEIAASFDSVELRSLHLDALDTRVRMRGGVSNIRQFLLSRTPAPLEARLDVVMDTIQLNRLAAAYEHGQVVTKGPEAAVLMPKSYYFTPEDTIAMLLPRNIKASVTASAIESKYTNLYLHDLAAKVLLSDGIVEAKDVKAKAAFGRLALDYYFFDTSDVDNLEMGLKAALLDVDVVQFFGKFHTLSLMIPGSHDFSGNLGLWADAHFNAFPNMYLDFPSIYANVKVKGRDLAIDQPRKYERLTRFLRLTNDSTLNIPLLDMQLSVHDNIMELYPMRFTIGDYRLLVAGLNNFSGGMYYHVGFEKSPLHLPFGVNIKGSFKHPKVRFGGVGWKPENSREVENSVSDSLQVNMLLETKYFIREMIHKAAMADSLGNNHYTY